MFGLEDQKKKKKNEFIFDLEIDLKDPKKLQETKNLIEGRIQKLKTYLRAGEDKELFNQLGTLLLGYTSLLKVLTRAVTKKG